MISSFHSDPIRILPYNPFEPLWDRCFDVLDRETQQTSPTDDNTYPGSPAVRGEVLGEILRSQSYTSLFAH